MSRPEPTDRCYICEGFCGLSGEHDHFPVPARLGGQQTMPICRPCHDMKDRLPLGKWDPLSAFTGLMGLWQKANRDERLLLTKLFHIRSQ